MRSPGSRLLPITASGPMRATVTWPSGSSTSVKNTSHDTWPWMLIGWTFFRIPSRVPLSTLSPQQNSLEREQVRALVAQRREQALPIVGEELLEDLRRQMPRVVGQERPLHPFHHVGGSG